MGEDGNASRVPLWGFWTTRERECVVWGGMRQGGWRSIPCLPAGPTPGPAPVQSLPLSSLSLPLVPTRTSLSPCLSCQVPAPQAVWIPSLEVMDCSVVLLGNHVSPSSLLTYSFVSLQILSWIGKECLFKQKSKHIFTLLSDIMDRGGPQAPRTHSVLSWKPDFKGAHNCPTPKPWNLPLRMFRTWSLRQGVSALWGRSRQRGRGLWQPGEDHRRHPGPGFKSWVWYEVQKNEHSCGHQWAAFLTCEMRRVRISEFLGPFEHGMMWEQGSPPCLRISGVEDIPLKEADVRQLWSKAQRQVQ